MKLGLGFTLANLTDDNVRAAALLGVTHAVVNGPDLGPGFFEFDQLMRLKHRVEHLAFDEVFHDEGDVDMLDAMVAYRQSGFDGVMTPDHAPRVAGDTGMGYRGRAFALGYLRALMQAAKRLT